ncbi:MAG TPA: hypothetical protein VFF64_25520 [Candidatus Eremiobacteraceae bacterium]|nr:hypothetical protein [Candidatus Eremiobacteraceae bacterium]
MQRFLIFRLGCGVEFALVARQSQVDEGGEVPAMIYVASGSSG